MSLLKNKKAAEKWLLAQCRSNIVQKSAIVVVEDNEVLKVESVNEAESLMIKEGLDGFEMLFRNGQVETKLIKVEVKSIKDIVEQYSKYDIARARGKRTEHSTTQYPSFLAKIEDVETCMKNLGYEIIIKGGGGKK